MAEDLRPVVRSRLQSKKITPTDEQVGQRIKFRRRMANLSLEELAAKLQIAPQQLQKYESGHNRVTAGRLLALAEILDVPIQWFFEKPVEDSAGSDAARHAGSAACEAVVPPEQLAEAVRLFAGLRDPNVRSLCLEMMRVFRHTKLE
jgi:transcriptional regulator with XRE-family HTH domain